MKRLSIAALLILVLSTGAIAHEGSIGLYTDVTGQDCDITLTPYLTFDLSILYFRSDAGPNGIFSAQFKLEVPASGFLIQTFVPSPEVSVTLGNIASGLSIAYSTCTGSGMDYLLIGTVSVVSFADVPHTLRIVTAEDIVPTNPPVAVRVSICDGPRTKVAVLGGWFTSPNGTCNIGTEETSWGAIKEMYKD